ncbi:hypothetical protein AXF42_Ash004746 [Apostasia shenzhenica]|uniref:Uncharacterized protein n=1 Tax=Apostasia shenzhenica TaxID=1088818 RepID=A0A2I0BHI2_9ASPA|nr:hypothetical protein AXF42_Ash004746 [Apostasia shenzhenica]
MQEVVIKPVGLLRLLDWHFVVTVDMIVWPYCPVVGQLQIELSRSLNCTECRSHRHVFTSFLIIPLLSMLL